jgi:hypothetical protein
VEYFEGDVSIERDGQVDPAEVSSPIIEGDRLTTGDGRLEILTAEWWRGIQQRLREGDLLEVLPYHRHRVRVFSSL